MTNFEPEIFATDEKLQSINTLIGSLLEKQTKLFALQSQIKEISKEIMNIEENKLPEALDAVGYTSGDKIILKGVEVSLKTDLQMSISAEKKPFVLSWLKEKGHSEIIKNQINVDLPKGKNLEEVEEIKSTLKELGLSFVQIEDVNTGTVKSLVKSLLSESEEVPVEDMGGRIYTRATIKL
jgi:hypothetical protein